MPVNPMMHAYPKQLESLPPASSTTAAVESVSQQSKMNDETADFFSSLNKLTSLPHHSSFHGHRDTAIEEPKDV